MSIDDATPSDWDNLKPAKNSPDFRVGDAECTLTRPEVPYAPSPDPVEKPAHYRVGEVEAIDYIHQQLGTGVKDYLLGNVHKYLHRHRFKGQAVEDLRKARWYLEKLIFEEVQGGMDDK